MAIRPPVHVVLDIAEAGADILRLLQLDRAWTAAGGRAGECTDRDREALVSLAKKLDAQLAAMQWHARNLRSAFDEYADWVNERVSAEIDEDHFTSSQREGITRLLAAPNKNYAERGAAIADFAVRQAPKERDEIRGKIPALRGDGLISTDMSHDMFCNLAAGGIVADLAVCPETLGVGCATALAIYIIADSEGC